MKGEVKMRKKLFKSESKRLLDLMINSIYTHKEIFLREIISNSSDALDKLCYKSLEENCGISREDLFIKVTVDKDNRIIKVSDNGIGMTDEELEKNLGIIANSGSLKFKTDMEKKEDAVLLSKGRHDPCIVHRARIVVDCITALTVADMLCTRYGTDWLAK